MLGIQLKDNWTNVYEWQCFSVKLFATPIIIGCKVVFSSNIWVTDETCSSTIVQTRALKPHTPAQVIPDSLSRPMSLTQPSEKGMVLVEPRHTW